MMLICCPTEVAEERVVLCIPCGRQTTFYLAVWRGPERTMQSYYGAFGKTIHWDDVPQMQNKRCKPATGNATTVSDKKAGEIETKEKVSWLILLRMDGLEWI